MAHKKITDPSNNRRKLILYGVCSIPDDGGMPAIDRLHKTRTEAVKAASIRGAGICKVEMLVPSEKNQWTITMECCTTQSTVPVMTKKITLETVNRPIVWGTNKLTDEAVQAYIETYMSNSEPKDIENFKESNGTLTFFKNPRSPQIN